MLFDVEHFTCVLLLLGVVVVVDAVVAFFEILGYAQTEQVA